MRWKQTPVGYVITSAKITRAGPIEYYGHELELTGAQANLPVIVHRPLDELTRPETLASFEGQTLTLTHPDSGEVNAREWKDKAIGHIQNVRAEGDYLVCDAYIKDAAAIAVLTASGIRELSYGYEPARLIERQGKMIQIDIRGNHVAVVAKGRLGDTCRLNDKKGKPMKRLNLKEVIALLKGKRANDADGQPLTEEELIGMIAALESTLAELDGHADEETLKKVAEVTAQLAELKAQLEALNISPATSPTDADGQPEENAVADDRDLRIAEMTGSEARKFFIDLVKLGYQASDQIVMPNTIALDNMDLLTLSGLYDASITSGVSNVNALRAIKQALNEFAGQDINIVGIPMGFAQGKGKGGANRACVYVNDEAPVFTDWALAPRTGNVFPRAALSWEIPVEAQFTGAIIHKLDRFVYVDYKS